MSEQRVIVNHATVVLNKQYAVTQSDTFREKVSGIYIIQDVSTDKCYVGASKNMNTRWTTHRNRLINYPAFSDIQHDFKSRPCDFVFVLIERCRIDQLEARENYWVNEHKAMDPEWGYNLRKPIYGSQRGGYTRIRVPAA